MFSSALLALSLAATQTLAVPFSEPALASELTSELYPRAACSGNTATTRTEWCDYDINTDWFEEVPDTGVTREFWLELTDAEEVSPDGVSRYAQYINGSIPGPTLVMDWGDEVIVHLTNSLTQSTNGTSLHFHGMRQNFTVQNDGVSSITQCPTAPGNSITYKWRAIQYGSSWYHSHFALQAWNGVFGGILINGPASANYDEDLGHIFLNDWTHEPVDQVYLTAESSGPPALDNGLINGTNVFGDDGSSSQTGSRFEVTLTEGSSYRMRLVNAAVDSHFKFSIDNHTMLVIAADLVPIEPYNTTVLSIGMGQRYDIVVTADQAAVASDFWMRAIPQSACSDNDSADNIKGIVHYGTSTGTPSTTAYTYTDSCEDETLSGLVPVVAKSVDSAAYTDLEIASVGRSNNVFKWYLNSTSMVVDWTDPTLKQIYDGVDEFETSNAVVKLPTANVWAYAIIQTTMSVPHPIHLHGFDFHVLAQGSGTYSSSTTSLNLVNPMRRDTAMLPGSGFVVLGFETNNPGAWLMHCHIGWHTSEGFAMQFVVREDEIDALIDYDSLNSTCTAWESHVNTNSLTYTDSGI